MDKLTTEITKLRSVVGNISTEDLGELSNSAMANLKSQMADPNGAFANDPALALEAAKTIVKLNNDTVETQRRVIDTLIRYQNATSGTPTPADNLLPETTEPEIEESASSTFA